MHTSKSGNKMILLGINASEYESECINCMYPQKIGSPQRDQHCRTKGVQKNLNSYLEPSTNTSSSAVLPTRWFTRKKILLYLLGRMGFWSKWRQWVSLCISTVWLLVLVNGVLGLFQTSGFEQGNLLQY